MKQFNTAGLCVPTKHYMVDLTERLEEMKGMVDAGQYFTINRGRQYGKTTTLAALEKYLRSEYHVLSLDFQAMDYDSFQSGTVFVQAFSRMLLRKQRAVNMPKTVIDRLKDFISRKENKATLNELFYTLSDWCAQLEKPLVLFIDEVDSATNNQVFLDFLGQLRYQYLERERDEEYRAFQSVILAGVTDVKNLKRKLRSNENHKVNSPWNIAVDFTIDMSLSSAGIAGMLAEYEQDHHTGMDIRMVANEIHDYTGGYPFLVSRICQILDTALVGEKRTPDTEPEGTGRFSTLADAWTREGISEAVRQMLMEQNTLFDSLMGKIHGDKALKKTLEHILFSGDALPFNPDDLSYADARMFGFIQNEGSRVAIANRIFEMRLYNYFLFNDETRMAPIFKAGENDKGFFIENGRLNMKRVLERYVVSFNDIYGDQRESFDEEEGRRRFLLYLRPIINGTGNYYIEARTRNNRRMDVVVDYLGERFVIKLKIWRGNAYNERGQQQLADYLDAYHLDTGYMLSYNFNRNKKNGLYHICVGKKMLIEAVV